MGYESVIDRGTIEILSGEEKYETLRILMQQYHTEDFQFNKDMMNVTTVMKLTVTSLTGKRRNNIH